MPGTKESDGDGADSQKQVGLISGQQAHAVRFIPLAKAYSNKKIQRLLFTSRQFDDHAVPPCLPVTFLFLD